MIPIAALAAGTAANQVAAQAGQKAMGALLNPLGLVTAGLNKFHASLTQLEAPMKALEGMFQHAAGYVAKLSPGRVEMMTRAIEDFHAAIGMVLTPVVETGTKVFRKLGDVIATLEPIWTPMWEKLSSALGNLFDSFAELYTEMVKLGNESGVLQSTLNIIVSIVRAITDMAKGLRSLLGGDANKSSITGNARGLAFQSAQTESVLSLISRAQQEAFSFGTGKRENSPEEKSANYLERIWNYFENQFVSQLVSALKQAPVDAAQSFVQNGPLGLFQSVRENINRIGPSTSWMPTY